ncbi:phenazine biosynthesis protein [Sorangium cellulosum]|uniref:Phenazine biosynthesis protein n=1 Tax=Sorangium cellulosum TaxID=56 RepID=A0A2L0F1K4_SORCE|nr:nuclear transport factor 2 family protein [Sorangium cellulosum]AUX45423.1 phenazine biosynthesis protein [Sorangium cellulosum]
MTHPLPHPRPLDAAQALDAHLDLIGRDAERWLDLFADDATVEFPYATALGVPGRFEGKPAIRRYFEGMLERFRDLSLRDVRRYPTTDPDVALAEVHGSAIILPAGKRYEQDYVMVVATRDGKIVRYREYWNPAPVVEAFGEALAAGREAAS